MLPALSAWRRQSREQAAVDGWRYRVDLEAGRARPRPGRPAREPGCSPLPAGAAEDAATLAASCGALTARGADVRTVELTVEPTAAAPVLPCATERADQLSP